MEGSSVRLLENCVVKDEVITVPGISKSAEYKKIADGFRRDLLSLKVPHWKVVGARMTVNGMDVLSSYIDKQQGISKSYAELLASVRTLVYAEGGGFPAQYAWLRDTFAGSVNFRESSFMACMDSRVMTDGNIFFECDRENRIKSLIPGKELVRFDKTGSMVQFMLHRGTGSFTFQDAVAKVRQLNTLVGDHSQDSLFYAPIAQDYDLTEVFSIKEYEQGDMGVYLRLKTKVEEDVLQQIIRGYAKEFADVDFQ